MSQEENQLYLSWEEFHKVTRALALKVKDQYTAKGLIGVSRGGLIPLGILAEELNIKLIETIGIQSYDGKEKGEISELKPLFSGVQDGGAGWIVIDELSDTGMTFEFIRRKLPNAIYVAPYVKPLGRASVDAFVEEIPQTTWIVFPWEKM